MTASTRRPGRPRSADFTTPLTIPGGAVAGAEIVRELPPEVALPAWQALRSVLMWAAEEPGQRSDLFEPCAMADWELELLEADWEPDLRVPLAVLIGELARPSQAAPDAIAHACLCVADWALENNGAATALAFAEAAALSWPQNPRYALMAGRLLRTHGRQREAEQWLKRAARAASSAGDSDAHMLALNSLGNLYYVVGNYPQAVKFLKDSLKVAQRHRMRDREGEVLHDLFATTIATGDYRQAEEYARGALESYQRGHQRLPSLAHDVAQLWMSRGHFARALFVLKELLPHFSDPADRFSVLASTARAAGACGEADAFAELLAEAFTLAEKARPAALVDLAMGAMSLQNWEVAESVSLHAIDLAERHGTADVRERAEGALEAARLRRTAENSEGMIEVNRGVDTLALGFVATLQATAQTS